MSNTTKLTEQELIDKVNDLARELYEINPIKQPMSLVQWVPIEKVEPNSYNPNSVANKEMKLLYISIKNDGYTQPIVTIYDEKRDKYVIVDGFHRYFTAKSKKEILDRNKGRVPITVINKDINNRMASTVRHNRARGAHSINGMSNMVFEMLDNGWDDASICNEMGLEVEELIKLKHLTGFAKLFEDVEYQKGWETRKMVRLRTTYEKQEKDN
jgi:hypothetical protein